MMISIERLYFTPAPGEAQPVGSPKLVVVLHAFTSSPERMQWVRQAVVAAFPTADTWVPRLPSSTWSTACPNAVVLELLLGINALLEARSAQAGQLPYGSIVFVGHSIGAMLARKAYICACGSSSDAPLEPIFAAYKPFEDWAGKVERVVLLAGMNRGWTVSHHVSWRNGVVFSVGTVLSVGYRLLGGKKFLINHFRQGAPFITMLRLQWLAMRQRAQTGGVGAALTVQLLGTKDDLVAPQDNIDLVTGRDFVYLDMPMSTHSNVVEMDPDDAVGGGRVRYDKFQEVLQKTDAELQAESALLSDFLSMPPQPDVTDVIFVIHGIRDEGYWTQKVARRIKEYGRKQNPPRLFATETSNYGYFPILPFLLPWVRRAKVEWLMDQYTENKALYPCARFSYVGHSNGTYLLAKALQEYPACRFHNVVFAGSVVRTDYDWKSLIDQQRVHAVLNYVATSDYVVAFFPKTLQTLHWQDLGGAGHDGFVAGRTIPNQPPPIIQQAQYVTGAHSAALVEDNWDAIATFIVSGRASPIPPIIEGKAQNVWISAFSKLPVLLLVLALFIWGGYLICTRQWSESTRVLALLCYVGVVWKGLTWA